jgi:5'-3' exonuclease
MIDMNGIFHASAQKAFEYGTHKPSKSLFGHASINMGYLERQNNMFKDVCETVDKLLHTVKPTKRLVLCVDGPAPIAKQCQQRKRRFISALEKETDKKRTFDSNCITPGTKFMDYLSKYIDWYIRRRISERNSHWSTVSVIFSNEKAPGEGEHKLINFIRKNANPEESYCIHGMDADLIMLSLGTHLPKFYVLRDDTMSSEYDYFLIDIGAFRVELAQAMRWKGNFVDEYAINDFIFMCFTVGNDFLPHIPGIEIIEGGIDFMLDVYKNVCESHGHLTKPCKTGIRFRRESLATFFGTISQYEQGVFAEKMQKKDRYFPDELLESCSVLKKGEHNVDIKQYRKKYYETKFTDAERETICHNYLAGMQWVLSYYTQGVPNWDWYYPYHYAPFSYTLAKHTKSFKFPSNPETTPIVPFIQLLSVLPPSSSALLPTPLASVLCTKMGDYCPGEFKIDLAGKRQAWEGTALLPMVDYKKISKLYFKALGTVNEKDLKRNILGKSFLYKPAKHTYTFRSFYGDFDCHTTPEYIDM